VLALLIRKPEYLDDWCGMPYLSNDWQIAGRLEAHREFEQQAWPNIVVRTGACKANLVDENTHIL